MGLKYVMVTSWGRHWDELQDNETYYTTSMFRYGMSNERIRESTPTVFIKIDKQSRKPERAWEGSVYDFRYENDRVYFKVKIEREIPIPQEYSNLTEGWYVFEEPENKMGLKYVMVTHFERHWDEVPETFYTTSMFRDKMSKEQIIDHTPTVFIKIDEQSKKPERALEGSVYGFRYEKDRVYFKVKIEREIPIPQEYSNLTEGWYVFGEPFREPMESVYCPPFFSTLNKTMDWKEFEKYTHILLKLENVATIWKEKK